MRDYRGELTLTVAPVSEPVSVAEAKLHLRVDESADDALIGALIGAARRAFEQINGRTMFSTTWTLTLEAWPAGDCVVLPRPPLQTLTSVTYTDEDGNAATLSSDDYYVVTGATPGYLALTADGEWPTATLRARAGIAVTFVAGWDDTADIPQEYKQAVLLLVGHWYENRESVATSGAVPKNLPMAFEALAMLDRVY